jgi:hypothetical protein
MGVAHNMPASARRRELVDDRTQAKALVIALYVASPFFAAAEEAGLAGRFGPEWDAHCRHVKVPWL